MKKLVAALSVICLLAIIAPCLPAIAKPLRLPHENPAAAVPASLDNAALLLSYSKIHGIIADRQYRSAEDALNELKQVVLPPGLRQIADRYEDLSRQISDSLNGVESLLNEAQAALSLDLAAVAAEKLDAAKISLDDADSLLVDVQAATATLGDSLGVFSALAASPLKQAYDRLSDNLDRIVRLTAELNRLRENLITNPQEEIPVQFYYPTSLEISAPDTAYPGLPAVISGRVTSTGGDVDRIINVFLDGILLAEKTASGEFSLEVTPPENASSGQHTLTVAVLPGGPYAGASVKQPITIARLPLYVDVRLPSFVLLPGHLRVQGSITDDFGPVADLSLTLRMGNSVAALTTAPDGGFQGSIKLHLLPRATVLSSNPFHVISSPADSFFDFSPIGIHEITITLESPGPWVELRMEKIQVLTINPVSAALVLAALAALVLFVLRRAGRQVLAAQEIHALAAESPPGLFPPPAFKSGLTAITARVISAYRAALSVIEKVTGVAMAPHVTLREYPGTVNLPSPAAAAGFTELTSIAETALYSPREPPEKASARAEKLAAAIREELLDGTP